MKRIWVNKANSFKEAEEFDRDYYVNMSASERIGIMQQLREIYFNIRREFKNEDRKRLRRVIKVI